METLVDFAWAIVACNIVICTPLAWLAAAVLDRPAGPSMLLGLVMGPVGWILIGFLEPVADRQCPACCGPISNAQATRCRHCGSELAGPPAPPKVPPLEQKFRPK